MRLGCFTPLQRMQLRCGGVGNSDTSRAGHSLQDAKLSHKELFGVLFAACGGGAALCRGKQPAAPRRGSAAVHLLT